MNKVIETILSRVSCKSYSDKKVPLSKVKQIVEAGKSAPSGMNRQICNILVLRNKNKVEKLRQASIKIFNRDRFYGASTICIVYGKRGEPLLIEDGSVILENMFIAATALKVDSCWINGVKDIIPFPETKLAKELGITEEYQVVGTCILGYKKEEPVRKPRKEDFIRYL